MRAAALFMIILLHFEALALASKVLPSSYVVSTALREQQGAPGLPP
jgi:hypothetical protein